MFYEAIVIDNTKYFETGTIRVRVAHFFQFRMVWDFSKDLPAMELGKSKDPDTGKETHRDYDVRLFAPLGGGNGYGTLFVPQINERGFIFFPENNYYYDPVWVGSYFRPFLDDNELPASTNIPSNLTDKDGIDSFDDHTLNYDTNQKTNILIRTKNTEYDKGDPDKLNWQKQPTTNVISVSDEGIKARHYNRDGGWKENEVSKYTDLDITDDNIKLQVNNKEDGNSFTVTQTSEQLTIDKNGTTKITIDKEGNITVDTPKKVFFKNCEKIEFLGNDRHLIGYEELYDALDTYVCSHIHITPNGPSEGPLDASMAPLRSVMKNDMIDMKEKNLLTE